MSWVRLDDQFADHPKVVGLSSDAFRLHVSAMCYCAAQLTDGRVTALLTRRLTWFVTDTAAVTNELVTAGLWEQDGDDYLIHDYLEYNPSGDDVRQQRKANADRQAKHRNGKRNDGSNSVSNALRNAPVTRPPTPSPSPYREEGIYRPAVEITNPIPETDPEFQAAISRLEGARIGGMNGSALLELSALWPDLTNGRRAWLDDAIRVAQANKAKSPVYALRVLASAIQNNERPGQVPERKPGKRGGTTSAELDAIFGVDIHGNPV